MVAPSSLASCEAAVVQVGDYVLAQLGGGDSGDDPQTHEACAYLEDIIPELRGGGPRDGHAAHEGLAERVFEGDAVGNLLDDEAVPAVGGEMGGIDGHVLAVGVVGEVAGYAVAHLKALNQPADFHHGAGRLVPGAAREGIDLLHLFAVGVFEGGHVTRADSARLDLDQHLAAGDLWRRNLADLVLARRHNERCSHLLHSPLDA